MPDAPEAGCERATLESTVALLADHTRPFGLESPVSFEAAQNPNPERFRRVYKVVSSALTADFMSLARAARAGNPAWSAEDRARVSRAAQRSSLRRAGEEDRRRPAARARRTTRCSRPGPSREWLSKEGTYSLRSKHASADDPTAHFLFGDKVGYCVHFAHAATYLLRALGVPARVATGYAVEESARQGGSAILISSGAAHAWPEVYLDGVGWVVVDVQPERTLDPAPEPPDADLQRLLGQLARGIKPLPPDGGDRPARTGKTGSRDLARWARHSLGRAAAWRCSWRSTWPSSGAGSRPASRAAEPAARGLPRRARPPGGAGRRAGAASRARRSRRACARELPSFEQLTALTWAPASARARAQSDGRGRARALSFSARAQRAAQRVSACWRRVLGRTRRRGAGCKAR